MSTNYFPDTDVMLFYLGTQQDYHIEAKTLFENTGNGKQLNGFLLKSINQEFDDISSRPVLDSSSRFILQQTEKEVDSNSLPKVKQKLTDLKDNPYIKPSQKIVIAELFPKLAGLKQLNRIQFNLTLISVFEDFKFRREVLFAKLTKCIENEASTEFRAKEAANIDATRKELAVFFPVRNTSDKNDNEHLIGAACYTGAAKIDGTFVTGDTFRRGGRRQQENSFENMAEKARNSFQRLMRAGLKMMRLAAFIKKLDLKPQTF